MNLRTRLARLTFKAAETMGGVRFLPGWVKDPIIDVTWHALVRDGYMNSAASACLDVIAQSFAEPELHVNEVTDGGDKVIIEDHPLRQLLAAPTRDEDYVLLAEDEFWATVVTFLGTGGNAYLYKERGGGGWPISLWPLHVGQMKPALHARKWISHYVLTPGDGPGIPVPRSDVIHLRWKTDPRMPQVGLSPLLAVWRDALTDTELRRYTHALAHNDAVPRTMIRMEGAVPADEVLQQIKREWERSYGGESRGGLAVVGSAVKDVLRLSANLQELAIESAHNIPESRIAGAFGGASVGFLAGLNVNLQRSTFSNQEEAETALHRRVLSAKWRRVASTMSTGLLREFSDAPNLSLEFDASRVQAMQGLRRQGEVHALSMYGGGLWSRNESRAATGRRALAEDVILEQGSWMPQPVVFEGETAPPPRPQLEDSEKGRAVKARRQGSGNALRAQLTERRRMAADLEPELTAALEDMRDEAVAAIRRNGSK